MEDIVNIMTVQHLFSFNTFFFFFLFQYKTDKTVSIYSEDTNNNFVIKRA